MSDAAPGGAGLAAVLLAAGLGTRMGGAASKLTLPLGDGTVVGGALAALLDAAVFSEVVVVTGHDAEAVEAAARAALDRPAPPVSVVHNPAYAEGMSGSIAVGVRSLTGAGGVAVALGDLPFVRPETIQSVALALTRPDGVVRPVHGGRPGHPVLFGEAHRPALATLHAGDDGARALTRGALAVPVNDPGVVLDLDTPEAYRNARRRSRAGG